MQLVGPTSSEVSKACLFVAALPFSRYSYAEPTLDMKQDAWLRCHVHAFAFFGGCTPIIVPDNLLTGVRKHPREGEAVPDEAYRELAAHYGAAVLSARVRHPRDKPSAENEAWCAAMYAASRRGIDRTREQFERIMGCVKEGLARGLSPEQTVASCALGVSPATICRWIEEGYAGTGNIELRHKVSYKPRKKKAAPRSTSHGAERSYAAFLGLGEEERSSACEMDTVTGRVHDSKCLLTLYLRPCKFQLMLLLGGKTAEEAARALDALEEAVGMDGFGRLFDPILTDNGAEFSDHGLIERSAGDSAAGRARVFHCDVRQSQQKGSCERNHVELRKVLPKGTSFDGLARADCALLMSHVNSEPRPSLAGLSPIRMFRLAYGGLAERLLDALGVEEIGPGEPSLTPSLLAHEEGRGMTI